MSNKNIIEEKVRELIGIAVGEASMCWSEIPTSVFDSDKAVDVVDRLTNAIIGLLAHQQARNIEAVEKIAIILYDARKGPNEKPNIKHALDKEDVLAAIRPQQQEEV